jgi:hypothetical protein
MTAETLLPQLLVVLGIGFLAANLRILFDFLRFLRLRSTALLVWPRQRPPFYGLLLALGVVSGALVIIKLVVQDRPPVQAFGESMMLLYYGYALPLSLRIGQGFYENGVWADSGFIPYSQIGGLTWREGDQVTLLLVSRVRQLARRLVVPQTHYAAVRRLLREKIAAHDIDFTGHGLDLGLEDSRDLV